MSAFAFFHTLPAGGHQDVTRLVAEERNLLKSSRCRARVSGKFFRSEPCEGLSLRKGPEHAFGARACRARLADELLPFFVLKALCRRIHSRLPIQGVPKRDSRKVGL